MYCCTIVCGERVMHRSVAAPLFMFLSLLQMLLAKLEFCSKKEDKKFGAWRIILLEDTGNMTLISRN